MRNAPAVVTDRATATPGPAPERQSVRGRWPRLIWRFGRPHTLVGTTLSVGGLYVILLAHWGGQPTPSHAVPVLLTWLSAMAANVFIVGLNQLTDVDLDRINKPGLPIASGELGYRTAVRIVVASAALSVVAGAGVGTAMVITVVVSMAIGAAYSLPPLRLKRLALWAALSISAVRGLLVNVGVFAALDHRLFGTADAVRAVPPQVWALAAFVAVFSMAIALAKDVPDVAGDRRFAIRSLAVRLGPSRAFDRARLVLSLAYLLVVCLAAIGLPGVHRGVLIVSHALLLAALWAGTWRIDFDDSGAVREAYGLIWRLFYAEYLVFPAACVLG